MLKPDRAIPKSRIKVYLLQHIIRFAGNTILPFSFQEHMSTVVETILLLYRLH